MLTVYIHCPKQIVYSFSTFLATRQARDNLQQQLQIQITSKPASVAGTEAGGGGGGQSTVASLLLAAASPVVQLTVTNVQPASTQKVINLGAVHKVRHAIFGQF